MEDTKTLDKWMERIYSETNFVTNIAIAAGGGIGLAVYLYFDDVAAGAFVAVTTFPLVKVLATPRYSRWKESRAQERRDTELKELYDNLGHAERSALLAFIGHGTSVLIWKDCDTWSESARAGVRSLMNRKYIREGEIGEYGAETLALDPVLFDYARKRDEEDDLPEFEPRDEHGIPF